MGLTAPIASVADDWEHQKLWTLDAILDVVCKGCEKDCEAAHMVDVWIDMAHTPIIITILEYAGLSADLRPNKGGTLHGVEGRH